MAKVPVKQRFLYEGNGQLPVCNHNTGESTIVDYKNPDGTYNENAQEEADHAFGIPSGSHEHYSLRLVALLDHLQDHFQADHYETISSYRDFLHNLVLRASGRPAVQTSLHLDGMATDGFFPGVDARTVWNYLRELRNGGAGYYYQDREGQREGRIDSFHVDIGPARFWSKVVTNTKQHPKDNQGGTINFSPGNNFYLLARTDRDIYRPGEQVVVKLARAGSYPIYFRGEFRLMRGEQEMGIYSFGETAPSIEVIDEPEERTFSWTIPKDFVPSEEISIEIRLIGGHEQKTPRVLRSNSFHIIDR